jgi:T4 RnlA family RNA ligase
MHIPLPEIALRIDQKYISVQKHPSEELYIYNYTPKAQFEKLWDEITLQCRGLILTAEGKIAARPFRKFFNLDEHLPHEIPNEAFEVYEKMDGSLGIIYWINDVPYIASRGSFDSDQARKATQLLHTKFAQAIPRLQKENTYLFEIIYPGNRIVVDYGDTETLVLLAVIETQTGKDLPLHEIGFPLVKRYHGLRDINVLKSLTEDNREGFVLKFESGFRVKVKFEEYVRLHRILTGVSNQLIWEMLKNHTSLDAILERVPDEFYTWVKQTRDTLLATYTAIKDQCKQDFKVLESRKTNALYFLTCRYPSILFAMLDGHDYSSLIWKLIKPRHEKPFKTDPDQ